LARVEEADDVPMEPDDEPDGAESVPSVERERLDDEEGADDDGAGAVSGGRKAAGVCIIRTWKDL
jgi:hypothetical protein